MIDGKLCIYITEIRPSGYEDEAIRMIAMMAETRGALFCAFDSLSR